MVAFIFVDLSHLKGLYDQLLQAELFIFLSVLLLCICVISCLRGSTCEDSGSLKEKVQFSV